MKKIFFPLMLVASLALTACASPTGVGTTQPSSSDQVATIVAGTMQAFPTNTPVPTAEPSCPEPMEGTRLLKNENMGYCLLYPEGLIEISSDPSEICLVPEGPTMGCHSTVAIFSVNDAAGLSADQIADKMIADSEAAIPGIAIQRTSATVSGQSAVVVEGLPGVTSTREILFVNADRLYRLIFILPDADPASLDQFERRYNTVINSFTLLPTIP